MRDPQYFVAGLHEGPYRVSRWDFWIVPVRVPLDFVLGMHKGHNRASQRDCWIVPVRDPRVSIIRDAHGSRAGLPAVNPDGALADSEDRILRDPGGKSQTGPVSSDRRDPDGNLTVVLAG